jgi:uroporphyrinogen-III synthase
MPEQRLATSPLQGKRVLITRTRDQASTLSERLRTAGAIPVEFPTIRIVPPSDWQQLDTALKRLYTGDSSGQPYYDWLVLTSTNGVRICCERLRSLGYNPRAMQPVRIATIGPATAAALEHYGITTNLVPDEYIAEGVAAALVRDVQQRGLSLKGQRILLARAAEARKVLVTELQEAGAVVDEVAAYFTHPVAHDDEQGREVLRLLHTHQLDILTFTSSSTVRNFFAWLKSCEPGMTDSPLDLVAQITIACIGPITSQTARELGLHVDIEAQEFTIDGLVEAMIYHEETL